MEQLTLKEAIEQGYSYAMEEDGEGMLIPLAHAFLFDGETKYTLASKETFPFQIADDVVSDLVGDYLCNQDEVADDDGYLNDLAASVDYSEITKKLNEAFSVTKYHYPTKIQLIP